MIIKVNYNPKTFLVEGYYPESVKYKSIPKPFIRIEDHEQDSSKKMCVINGKYTEYRKPDAQALEEAKVLKIADCKRAFREALSKAIKVRENYYLKSSSDSNLFLAGHYMLRDETKTWQAFDSKSKKIFNKKGEPLHLELTKSELVNASNSYEENKTYNYLQRSHKILAISRIATLEDLNSFDATLTSTSQT